MQIRVPPQNTYFRSHEMTKSSHTSVRSFPIIIRVVEVLFVFSKSFILRIYIRSTVYFWSRRRIRKYRSKRELFSRLTYEKWSVLGVFVTPSMATDGRDAKWMGKRWMTRQFFIVKLAVHTGLSIEWPCLAYNKPISKSQL